MNLIKAASMVLVWILCSTALAGDRFPGATWTQYATPEEAGFSADKLQEAREYWESTESAAAMVVLDGAVVAAWGDVDRRFLLHSARKSIMSALYGIHVDAGNIDVQKTMAQLGIDDANPRLNAEEKQAKIIDLLKARSGVYHLAAAEPSQNPKPPRGAFKPGTHWCYNNWDFNTLCTILEQETGVKVFEEFGKRFADPLGMQDYRARDGMYLYERDKSIHPAYHIRMSARDMARFGLLFLNKGKWNGEQILSSGWVRESTRSHSDAGDSGYGYMWWVPRAQPFARLKMFSALGVGRQSIDVLPGADMVFVLRTNTYDHDEVTEQQRYELLDLILAAKTSRPKRNPELVPLPPSPKTLAPVELKQEQKGQLIAEPTVASSGKIVLDDGDLVFESPSGKFGLIPLADCRFVVEDTYDELFFEKGADGSIIRIITENNLNHEGYGLLGAGKVDEAIEAFKKVVEYYPDSANAYDSLGEAYAAKGDIDLAISNYRESLKRDPGNTGAEGQLELLELRKNPVEVARTTLGLYAGSYGSYKILLQKGDLHLQRPGDRPRRLI
ncbi:MAG: serine hydrolase, partial [Phycisphaerae bacterium]